MACSAYAEQLGLKRHWPSGPKIKVFAGDIVQRYIRMPRIKVYWAAFKPLMLLTHSNNLASRTIVKKSFSTSVKVLPLMLGRATSTKSKARPNSRWCNR